MVTVTHWRVNEPLEERAGAPVGAVMGMPVQSALDVGADAAPAAVKVMQP
jgi:hypothetical protein